MDDEYQLRKDVDGIYREFYDYQREKWDVVTQEELKKAIEDIPIPQPLTFDEIYPVGSIYISINNTNPSTLFGGTWVQIEDTFLLASGSNYTAGSTGGEATHTLTTDELPAHTHGSKSLTGSANVLQWKNGSVSGIVTKSGSMYNLDSTSGQDFGEVSLNIDATHEHTSVGSGTAHNNMPPYLTVYMWKRTA